MPALDSAAVLQYQALIVLPDYRIILERPHTDQFCHSVFQIEIASGKFPYASSPTPFEQLKQVVKDPPPKLPPGQFTPEFEDFIAQW